MGSLNVELRYGEHFLCSMSSSASSIVFTLFDCVAIIRVNGYDDLFCTCCII